MDKQDATSILLTYKGKLLLMLFENNPLAIENQGRYEKSSWRFVGGKRKTNESFQEAISRLVRVITGLKLENIKHLSTTKTDKKKKYFCHAKLTDKDVNNIERASGFLLQFFTVKEMYLLTLSPSTRVLADTHRDFIESVNVNNNTPHASGIL